MKIICDQCYNKFIVTDEKLPEGKIADIRCPKCKKQIFFPMSYNTPPSIENIKKALDYDYRMNVCAYALDGDFYGGPEMFPEYFKKAIGLYPNFKEAYLSAARFYEEYGDKEKALKYYNHAIGLIEKDE